MWKNLFVVASQFAIKNKLKDLTHMFYLSLNPMSQIIFLIFFLMFSH